MESTTDVSKIINLIMENPELIESIRNLVSKDKEQKDSNEPNINNSESVEKAEETVADAPIITEATDNGQRGKRNALLKALKPYVSGERAKAIDTMMSLADVMDIIRKG